MRIERVFRSPLGGVFWMFVFGLPGLPSLGSAVVWQTDHLGGAVAAGVAVTAGSNPWWSSSSPGTRFLMDGEQLIVALEPGHEVRNSVAIPLEWISSGGLLEVLMRTDEALTLGLGASTGSFSTLSGDSMGSVLMVPAFSMPDYSWVPFLWAPDEVTRVAEAGGPAAFSAAPEPELLTLTLFSIDSPLYIAGARLSAVSIPEPSRVGLMVIGGMMGLGRRRR